MKFLADVNIANLVIKYLRNQGHEVLDIKKVNPLISDKEIIALALDENRIVITHDKDFLVWVQYPKYQVPTIIIRLNRQNARHFCERIGELLNTYSSEEINYALTILTEDSIELNPY